MSYAIKGILYFAVSPSLWLATICPLIMMLIVAIVSIILMFMIALTPQVHMLSNAMPEWLAWFVAVIFVLLESLIAILVAVLILLPAYMDNLFDKVLALRGHTDLLAGRQSSSCCTSLLAACRVSVVLKIVLLIVTLPINAIPVVGTIAWVVLNGTVRGWEGHQRYFDLKGWGYAKQKVFVRSKFAEYTSFGTQALALEIIPGFGFIFMFTNVVGAALWASDMELLNSSRPIGEELNNLHTQTAVVDDSHKYPMAVAVQ